MLQLSARYSRFKKLAKFSTTAIQEYGFRFFLITAYIELKKYKLGVFAPEYESVRQPDISNNSAYKRWLQEHSVDVKHKSTMKNELLTFIQRPKLSIILSVDEKNKKHVKKSLRSMINQIYENWEICINCPVTILNEIKESLNSIMELSGFNSILQEDSINNALSHTSGDFVAFVNCGDVLTQDALFKAVQCINSISDIEAIYSDEDKIISEERQNPFFKPDWSPYLFLNYDYISNFYIVKKKILGELAFNEQYGDAKHYDFLLRLSEKTQKIIHIPTVLVSVRSTIDSNSYEESAQKAISEALIRQGINGRVIKGVIPKTFRIIYPLHSEPKITIIIPTKDNKILLKRCLTSIKNKTRYRNYEIIIIDNNSTDKETLSYLESLPYTVIRYNSEFNFSKMNNLAVSSASGEYLLFLNDDTAALESNWLSEMLSICQMDDVGIVGAKLVHGNNTIQHAGISLLKTGAGFHPMQGVNANSPGYFGFLNIVRDCSAVTGACLLIKKKIFEEVGGFDDRFDLYYGDTDLCLKVINRGYGVVYTPYAVLLHQGSSKIKEYATAFFTVENHHYFIKKWPNIKRGDPFYNPNLGFDYKIEL